MKHSFTRRSHYFLISIGSKFSNSNVNGERNVTENVYTILKARDTLPPIGTIQLALTTATRINLVACNPPIADSNLHLHSL